MSGVRTGGRLATYAGVVAAVLAILVVGAALFFLSGPLISAVHAVSGGSWGADLALGLSFVLVPLAVIFGYGYLAHRHGWRQRWGWFLLVLYVPAVTLEPFSRSGTNTQLDYQVNTQLPGLLGGMGIGVGVLALGVAVLAGWAKLRGRRGRPSR
jgi:K+-transporting ATPase A subunit